MTPQHLTIDGKLHTLIPLASLETAAYERPGVKVTYPEDAGYATALIEGKPCAAWWEPAVEGSEVPC